MAEKHRDLQIHVNNTYLVEPLYSYICTFPPAEGLESSLPTANIGG